MPKEKWYDCPKQDCKYHWKSVKKDGSPPKRCPRCGKRLDWNPSES